MLNKIQKFGLAFSLILTVGVASYQSDIHATTKEEIPTEESSDENASNKIVIESLSKLNMITIENHLSKDTLEAKLPKMINALDNKGNTHSLNVTWNLTSFVQGQVKKYDFSGKVILADNMEFDKDVVDAKINVNVIKRITSKVEKKGSTTYYYTLKDNNWFNNKKVNTKKNTTTTSHYNYSKNKVITASTAQNDKLVPGNAAIIKKNDIKTKSGKKIVKEQAINYNSKAKVYDNSIKQLNKKNKKIKVYHNKLAYHKNGKVSKNTKYNTPANAPQNRTKIITTYKSNSKKINSVETKYVNNKTKFKKTKLYYKSGKIKTSATTTIKSKKYTNNTNLLYKTNGKKKRLVVAAYKNKKVQVKNDYRYNKNGKLASTKKQGNAFMYKTTYNSSGKALITYTYKYNAKGEKVKVVDNTVWDRLAKCESGGRWNLNTGNGYYGGLQFSAATWRVAASKAGVKASYAHNASREEQIKAATWLQKTAGWGQWPACTSKLGLR